MLKDESIHRRDKAFGTLGQPFNQLYLAFGLLGGLFDQLYEPFDWLPEPFSQFDASFTRPCEPFAPRGERRSWRDRVLTPLDGPAHPHLLLSCLPVPDEKYFTMLDGAARHPSVPQASNHPPFQPMTPHSFTLLSPGKAPHCSMNVRVALKILLAGT